MAEEKRVPKIRFKGFDEEWELRIFGDVFREYSEKNHEELPPLMIVQGRGTLKRDESERNLTYDKANLSNYKKVDEGDFIVHLRSFEGGLEIATNTGIISPAYHTFHGENTDSTFYYSLFRSRKFIDADLKPHVYGIRDGRSIDIEGMKTIQIPNPDYKEQKIIGELIASLNETISYHQQKYHSLQHLKETMLEKMFPKDGADVPEIRFKGFSGAWVKTTLGKIADITMGQSPSGETYSDEPSKYILVQGNADLVNGWVMPRVWTTQCTKSADAGDLILSVRAPAGAVGRTAYNVVLGRGVAGIKGNDFIYYSLEMMDFRGYWKMWASGSTFESLNSDVIINSELYIPSEEEQDVIGEYFEQLDNNLSSVNEKLTKLHTLKKALLEKMFV